MVLRGESVTKKDMGDFSFFLRDGSVINLRGTINMDAFPELRQAIMGSRKIEEKYLEELVSLILDAERFASEAIVDRAKLGDASRRWQQIVALAKTISGLTPTLLEEGTI